MVPPPILLSFYVRLNLYTLVVDDYSGCLKPNLFWAPPPDMPEETLM